jgi:hypothetical protein
VNENKFQAAVKSATADINKEAAKLAADKLKAQQNNNGGRRAVVNDGEFDGPNVSMTKGSVIVTNVLNAGELHVGAVVSGQGVANGTVISSVAGTTVTLSKAATATSTTASLRAAEMVQRVAFSPWEALVQAIMFSNEAAYVN